MRSFNLSADVLFTNEEGEVIELDGNEDAGFELACQMISPKTIDQYPIFNTNFQPDHLATRLISNDFLSFLLEGVLLVTAGTLGVVGNLSAILLFGRQRLQRNFHALMVSLALFDLAYILVSGFIFALPQFFPLFSQSKFYCVVLPFLLPVAQMGLTGSIFFTMAITVERYFTVCHPFYRVSHSWPAKAYVVPIVSFAILYNIPKFFELDSAVYPAESFRRAFVLLLTNGNNTEDWTNEQSHEEATSYVTRMGLSIEGNYSSEELYLVACQSLSNGSVRDVDTLPSEAVTYTIVPTSLRLNQVYVEVFCGWINFIVHNLFPYALLLVLNTQILKRLKSLSSEPAPKVDAGRRSSSKTVGIGGGAKKKDVQLAKISFVIVIVFVVCHSFRWVPNIYELYLFHQNKKNNVRILKWPDWVEITSNVSHFLCVVNSSVNFYIYLIKHPGILPCCRSSPTSSDNAAAETMAMTLATTDPAAAQPETSFLPGVARADCKKRPDTLPVLSSKKEYAAFKTGLIIHEESGGGRRNASQQRMHHRSKRFS